MSKYSSLRALHTAIADSVRAKTGSTDGIKVEDLPEAVASIPSGGGAIIGTFTVASDTPSRQTIVFDTPMEQDPNIVLIYAREKTTVPNSFIGLGYIKSFYETYYSSANTPQWIMHIGANGLLGGGYRPISTYGIRNLTRSGFEVSPYSPSFYFRAELTYEYVVM